MAVAAKMLRALVDNLRLSLLRLSATSTVRYVSIFLENNTDKENALLSGLLLKELHVVPSVLDGLARLHERPVRVTLGSLSVSDLDEVHQHTVMNTMG